MSSVKQNKGGLWENYWKAIPYLVLGGMIVGPLVGSFFDRDENYVVLAHDSLKYEKVICVNRSRSINAMKAFVYNEPQRLDSQSTKFFANDSFFVKHGDGLLLLDTLDDSVTLRVKTYSKLLRKYSNEAFILKSFVRVAN